jgi:hypothetical protein
MSKQEFGRLEVPLRVQSGSLRIADARERIGLHRRQVFRLLRGLKQDGAPSLLSKRRGKPSNHRLPAQVRTMALSIVWQTCRVALILSGCRGFGRGGLPRSCPEATADRA